MNPGGTLLPGSQEVAFGVEAFKTQVSFCLLTAESRHVRAYESFLVFLKAVPEAPPRQLLPHKSLYVQQGGFCARTLAHHSRIGQGSGKQLGRAPDAKPHIQHFAWSYDFQHRCRSCNSHTNSRRRPFVSGAFLISSRPEILSSILDPNIPESLALHQAPNQQYTRAHT